MDKTSFGEEVYSVVASIPPGRVLTYGQGRLAPFWPEQRELLEKEGTVFKKNGCVDIKASGWEILKEVIS